MKFQAYKGWLVILCVFFACCCFLLPAFSQCEISSFKAETTELIWSPQNTLALLVGVLHWPDKNFASYDQENRQDEKLYRILLNRGIKSENIIFLKDDEATLERINESLKKLAQKGNASSTFLFYYAGHGDRINEGKDAYFANFDCDSNDYLKTGFSIDTISEILVNNFKGNKAVLTADCCYSGALNNVADTLSAHGIQTLVLTSAVESNYSTGNWTFTQSLNEILVGKPVAQFQNANINAQMAADYIKYNMAYEEQQLANFYSTAGFPKNFVLSQLKQAYLPEQNLLGKYFKTTWRNEEYLCKVIGQKGSFCRIRYPGWGPEWDEWRQSSDLQAFKPVTYDVNAKVEVEWNKAWYPAQILKLNGFFHYIHYDGYENYWNEWVSADRIRKK